MKLVKRRAEAEDSMRRVPEHQKKYYDRKYSLFSFLPSDLVCLRFQSRNKLEPSVSAIAQVKEVVSPVSY